MQISVNMTLTFVTWAFNFLALQSSIFYQFFPDKWNGMIYKLKSSDKEVTSNT